VIIRIAILLGAGLVAGLAIIWVVRRRRSSLPPSTKGCTGDAGHPGRVPICPEASPGDGDPARSGEQVTSLWGTLLDQHYLTDILIGRPVPRIFHSPTPGEPTPSGTGMRMPPAGLTLAF
jgi:hypothetical protein